MMLPSLSLKTSVILAVLLAIAMQHFAISPAYAQFPQPNPFYSRETNAIIQESNKSLSSGALQGAVGTVSGAIGGISQFLNFSELANRITGGILIALNEILMGLSTVYTTMVRVVLFFLGNTLDYIIGVSKFAENEWVQRGWRTVRDTLNIFFILALLVISFTTIAGTEGYGMKQLLPRLIIGALLVNFSLAIGGAFVSASRIAMQTFAGGQQAGTSLSLKLANVAVVSDFYTFKPEFAWENLVPRQPTTEEVKGTAQIKYTVGLILANIMLTIITVAIGAVALMLVVRVVILYVLLILSPVGFVFSILPRTAGYAQQWWDTFIKYVLFGPVVVFFLRLTADIGTTEQGGKAQFRTLSEQLGITPGGDPVSSFFLDNPVFGSMLEAIFVVLFIIISLLVAQQMSVLGASIGKAAAQRWVPGTAYAFGRAGREVGKGAAYGVLKAGESKGFVGEALRGIGRPLGAASRVVATPYQYGRRIVAGETVDQQIDQQKKSVSSMGETGILALARSGNMGAMQLAMDRDYGLSEKDFQRALGVAPVGSEFRANVQKGYEKKAPVTSVLGGQMRNNLASGRAASTSVTADQKDRMQKALRRIKPEDYAKLDANDLLAASAAGVSTPITKSQLEAVFNSTNTAMQDAAESYVRDYLRRLPQEQLKPGQKAIEKLARERLGI